MLNLLAILVFPAAIGLAGLLAIRTVEESSSKIAAALGGLGAATGDRAAA